MNARAQPEVRTVIVKLSSRCNLSCDYCYLYEHADRSFLGRPRFMAHDVFDGVLRLAADAAATNGFGRVNLIMHGGEPTLLGLRRFREYVAAARQRLGTTLASVSLQTNGTLLTDAWLDALACDDVDVGVSLDGPREVHDAVRRERNGTGSWERAVSAIRRMQERGMDVGTLTVVTPGGNGLEVFDHLRSLGVRRMNFLIPDVSHDNFTAWYGHLGPTPVADFLLPIFDAWFELDDPTLLVGVCWDVVERLLGGPGLSDMFGNPRLKYVAVETDGTIEALDALKVGQENLADTGLNVLSASLAELSSADTLAARAVTEGFELAAKCAACRYAVVCGGGYLPHRYSVANEFANPSVWCNDLLEIFGHAERVLARASSAT